MNKLQFTPRNSLFLVLTLACVLSGPTSGQQPGASEGFGAITSEGAMLDDMRQFLDLHIKLGNTAEAARYANKILAKAPKDADALGALLGMHLKQRNAKSALSYAGRYRAVRPGGESDALYASALRLNGENDKALSVMLRRYAKVPKGSHFPQLLELCYCYYDCRRIEEARECFIKVRDDKRFSVKNRSEATRELAAIKREEDIREAYLAIEQRNLKKARAIAEDVAKRAKKPNRDVTALFAVLNADERGEVKEAVATFTKLKATHKGPEPFPYQSTYAILLLDDGRYAEAEAAALEAASVKSPFLTAEDDRGRTDTLRLIRQYSRSMLSAEGIYQSQDEGKAYRLKGTASMPVNKKRTRVGVEYQFNELDFDSPIVGANETDYHSVFATLSHQISPKYSVHAAAGAVAGNLAYRIAARMAQPSKEDFLEVVFSGGHRPTDTMTLEAFGSKERRVSVKGKMEVPTNRRVKLSAEVFMREIDIDQPLVSDLGRGWGARWEAEYLFYKFQRTMLSVAYVGGAEHFDYSNAARASSLYGSLVEDDLHKHGIAVRASQSVSENMMAHIALGVDYRFDDKQLTYSAAGGLEWWVSQYTRLTSDVAYYTSGLAGNAGSGYVEGRVGVNSTF